MLVGFSILILTYRVDPSMQTYIDMSVCLISRKTFRYRVVVEEHKVLMGKLDLIHGGKSVNLPLK